MHNSYRNAFPSDFVSNIREGGVPTYTSADLDDHLSHLVARDFGTVYPNSKIDTLHEEYSNSYSDSAGLLARGTYVELGGRSLGRLPEVESFVLCGGNGCEPAMRVEGWRRKQPQPLTWLQHNFPEAGYHVRDVDMWGEEDRAYAHFAAVVLRLLTISQSRITSLVG